MTRLIILTISALLLSYSLCTAGLLDDLFHEVLPSIQQQSSLNDSTITKGLKEALATGTERAVKEVSKPDGYFGNQLIKILLPDKIQRVANILGAIGYQKQVDDFVLSMNRAAEKAAPKAAGFFGDAIRQMTVEDAREILSGGDTAATKFFEKKTRSKLFEAFKPDIAQSMDQVGTVRAYKNMIGKYETAPLAALAGTPPLDLDTYVTNKALDGLFTMVGQEEKNIRTNPVARTTDLLRKVFGESQK
jgi:RNA binding exosome subunit